MKGMRPVGEQLSGFYSDFESAFIKNTGVKKFVWMKGEKAKAVQGFIRFTEAHGVRDRDLYEEMYAEFFSYVSSKMIEWLKWSKANRTNLFGFVLKSEEMDIYVAKKSAPTSTAKAETVSNVGVKTQDEWDL